VKEIKSRLLILTVLLATVGIVYAATTATLTWTAPTLNCDGSTATGATAITGYKVYSGTVGRVAAGLPATSSGGCSDVSQVKPSDPKVAQAYNDGSVLVTAATLSKALTMPDDGLKHYFAVTAISAQGESNLTNEVSKQAANPPLPQAPGNLTIN